MQRSFTPHDLQGPTLVQGCPDAFSKDTTSSKNTYLLQQKKPRAQSGITPLDGGLENSYLLLHGLKLQVYNPSLTRRLFAYLRLTSPPKPQRSFLQSEDAPPLFKLGGGHMLAFANTATACISGAWLQEVVCRDYKVEVRPQPPPQFIHSNLPISPHNSADVFAALQVFWSRESLPQHCRRMAPGVLFQSVHSP